MGSYIDPAVTWKDIAWIRTQISQTSSSLVPPTLSSKSSSSSSSSSSPSPRTASSSNAASGTSSANDVYVGVKGITCVSDVLLALHYGADIIWLSNHGGRSLDTAPPALYVLAELQRDHPWVFSLPRVDIYVDGGIRRGTDIVKALCLGARGVAMGRPFMYALQYGTEGVRHAIQSESVWYFYSSFSLQ
jgi:L-lactate dehydrogenase (cytochrome)